VIVRIFVHNHIHLNDIVNVRRSLDAE